MIRERPDQMDRHLLDQYTRREEMGRKEKGAQLTPSRGGLQEGVRRSRRPTFDGCVCTTQRVDVFG
jgi:hypothetical protein